MVLKTAGCCTVHHERTVALYRDYKIPLCFFFYKYYYFLQISCKNRLVSLYSFSVYEQFSPPSPSWIE